jgi:superfamily I DNA and/or RNA helicase
MQLRPHVQNHELSAENQSRTLKYNLDVSLFERLCASGVRSTSENNIQFPFARLTVQRRMHPNIADLVRRPLYQDLEDHARVQKYPQVPGMFHHLYWLDHSHHEAGSSEFDLKGTSHSNDYEVEMVKRLVSHLTKQGCYGDGDLAVITPYVGQLRKLRNELRNMFSVQLSEKDQDEVDTIDEVEVGEDCPHSVQRKVLSQSVRIATVFLHLS